MKKTFIVPNCSGFMVTVKQLTQNKINDIVNKYTYFVRSKDGDNIIDTEYIDNEVKLKVIDESLLTNIVGWSNVFNANGEQVAFNKNALKSLINKYGLVKVDFENNTLSSYLFSLLLNNVSADKLDIENLSKYLLEKRTHWRYFDEIQSDAFAALNDNNKSIVNYYNLYVSDMVIESGCLYQMVSNDRPVMQETKDIVRKLSLIYDSEKYIMNERIEARRNVRK